MTRTRILSLVTVLVFLLNQVSFVSADVVSQLVPQANPESNIRTVSADAPQTISTVPADPDVITPIANSSGFVSGDQPVSDVNNEIESKEKEAPELERYTLEDAIDLFRPEFATAVILKDVSAQDLQRILELPFEVGLAVVDGEVVMFSSGGESEIDVLKPVEQLLENADFIAHTHPEHEAVHQPSGMDIQLAGEMTEYVISPEGVYLFNHSGTLNPDNPYSYQYLVNQLYHVVQSTRDKGQDTYQTRLDLNEFIQQMDFYNNAPEWQRILLRSGAAISQDPTLGINNVTVLSNLPDLLLTGGSSAGSSVSQNTPTQPRLSFDLRAIGSYAGMSSVWDDFGDPVVQSQDFSNVASIVFGIKSDAFQVKVEFVDANNNRDSFILTGVSSAEQFYRINLNLLNPNVNRSQIALINFVVDQNSVFPVNRIGTLDVRINGLDVTGNQTPNTNLTLADVTDLPGRPGPALVTSPNTTATLVQEARDQFTMTYDVTPVVTNPGTPQQTITNKFATTLVNYDDFGTPQTKEFRDLSAVTQLNVGLAGTPGMDVRVVFEDALGGRDYLSVGQISATEQFYGLNLSFLNGVDRSRITNIGFEVAGYQARQPDPLRPNPGPFNGTLTVRLLDLDVTGFIPPRAGLTPSTIPGLPKAILTPGSSTASFVTQNVANLVSDTFDLTLAGTYSGITLNYNNPATAAIETGNISTLQNNTLTVGLSGAAGMNVRAIFEDINGNKDFLNLGYLSATEQFYQMNLSLLDGVDLTRIKGINFVVDRFLVQTQTGTFNLRVNGLDFSTVIQPNPALTLNDVTVMPGLPNAVLMAGSPLGSTIFQSSPRDVDLLFDLSQGGSAGITVDYDNSLTSGIESRNLSGQGQIILGLNGPNGARVRMSFEDVSGNIASVTLGSVISADQFYRVNLAQLSGVNLAQIRRIHFIVDPSLVPNLVDSLSLILDGLDFTAPLVPDATLTQANLTVLPGSPTTFLIPSPNDKGVFALVSNSRFDLKYDFSQITASVGTAVSFDNPQTAAIETQNLSGFPSLVFGSRENLLGGSIRVEIQDAAGIKKSVLLSGIDNVERFFRIPTNRFNGLDLTQVRSVNFFIDSPSVINTTGTFRIRVGGLGQPALTQQEEALRQNLLATHLGYFVPGVGIDPVTHFPFDSIDVNNVPQRFTQPTSIGFYVQILGDIANGRIGSQAFTSSQALQEANLVMNGLLNAQSNFSFNGLLPFMNLTPLSAGTTNFGYIDNANLAQSLAVFIGALERGVFSPADQPLVASLINRANNFLLNMRPGFLALIDPTFNLFRGAFDTSTGQFTSFADRLMFESRSATAFVVSFYGLNQGTWSNLAVTLRNYTDSLGQSIDVNVPFDGGAFQVFWSLLRTNEEKMVEILPSLENFLYATADFSFRNNIPGFVSAVSTPEDGYEGLLGVPDISEMQSVNPNALGFDLGSVYALAAAFSVAPSFVLNWLSSIRAASPAFSGPLGFFDSFRSPTEVSQKYLAIDQASIILGLADTGGDDFDVFMRNRALDDDFERLYQQFFIDITPVSGSVILPGPPQIPTRTFTVLNNFSSNGVVGAFTNGGTTLTRINTYNTGLNFNYTNQTTRAGHFFVLDQVVNASGQEFVIKYSATTTPQDIEVEFVDVNNVVVSTASVPLLAGQGILEEVIGLPNTVPFSQIRRVNLLINPPQTGVQAANFRLHSLAFRTFNNPPTIFADATLTAQSVTNLPNSPRLVVLNGSQLGTSVNQTSATRFDLNVNNFGLGETGGSRISFDDPVSPAVETANLSALQRLVLGLSSNSGPVTSANLVLTDASGNRATYLLDSITAAQQFWAVDFATLPAAFDRTRVTSIDLVVDENVFGTLNVLTAGLAFTPVFNPDPTLNASNVTVLPGLPPVDVTGGSVLPPATTVTQTSSSQARLSFNNPLGQYGGLTVFFDNPITAQIEFQDLSSVSNFILGIRGSATLGAKVELIDINGARTIFNLSGIDTTERFWRLPTTQAPQGFRFDAVRFLNIIEDAPGQGTLDIRLAGLNFIPQVAPNGTLTINDVTQLPGNPQFSPTGGSTQATVVNQISPSRFDITYNNVLRGDYGGGTAAFDIFSTPQIVETQSLAGFPRIVLGLASNATSQVKVEFEDINGIKAIYVLNGLAAAEQFYALDLNFLPANFDRTRVKFMNVIVDAQGQGTVNVRTNGLTFTPRFSPEAGLTAANVTTLPGRPPIFPTGGSVGGSLVQSSTSQFRLNFNNQNPGDYFGVTGSFDNLGTLPPAIETQDLSALVDLIIGISGTTPAVKVELIDSAGTKAVFNLIGITGVEQFWRLPLSQVPQGFLLNQVRFINVIEDMVGQGSLDVRLRGLDFVPQVSPNGALTQADVTNLPGSPRVIRTGGSVAGSTVNQISSSLYDITGITIPNPTLGAYAGSTQAYDDFFTQPPVIETQDLSGLPQIVFGFSSPQIAQAKVEIVDINNVKQIYQINGITGVEQFWSLDQSVFPAGFDRTRIKFINVIVDTPVANGSLRVRSNGLSFTQFFNPNPALTAADVTRMPGFPPVFPTGGSTAGVAVNQFSTTQFRISGINNQAAANFGGGTVGFDNGATPLVAETQDLSSNANLVIGLVSAAFATAKVELIDINNLMAVFNLTGITGAEQFWSLPLAQVPQGFRLAQVKFVNVVVDAPGQGQVDVRLRGFVPLIAPDPALTQANVTNFAGSPQAFLTSGGASGGSTVTQPSASEMQLNYTNPNPAQGDFAAATAAFDRGSTPQIESVDLSGIGSITVGIRGNPSRVKLEIQDSNANRSFVYLTGVQAGEQFWQVPMNNFTGVNLAQVTFIHFLVEEQGPGVMTVRLNGLQFTPFVNPNPALGPANVTNLPTVPFATALTGGSNPGSNVVPVSAGQFNLNYNVTAPGSFAGGSLEFNNGATPQTESTDLSNLAGNQLVFGIRRRNTSGSNDLITVKLELIDANGMRATVLINSVTTNVGFYAVPFSMLPPGFDLTRVTLMSFVVDQNGVTQPTQIDTLEVFINGIQ